MYILRSELLIVNFEISLILIINICMDLYKIRDFWVRYFWKRVNIVIEFGIRLNFLNLINVLIVFLNNLLCIILESKVLEEIKFGLFICLNIL